MKYFKKKKSKRYSDKQNNKFHCDIKVNYRTFLKQPSWEATGKSDFFQTTLHDNFGK